MKMTRKNRKVKIGGKQMSKKRVATVTSVAVLLGGSVVGGTVLYLNNSDTGVLSSTKVPEFSEKVTQGELDVEGNNNDDVSVSDQDNEDDDILDGIEDEDDFDIIGDLEEEREDSLLAGQDDEDDDSLFVIVDEDEEDEEPKYVVDNTENDSTEGSQEDTDNVDTDNESEEDTDGEGSGGEGTDGEDTDGEGTDGDESDGDGSEGDGTGGDGSEEDGEGSEGDGSGEGEDGDGNEGGEDGGSGEGGEGGEENPDPEPEPEPDPDPELQLDELKGLVQEYDNTNSGDYTNASWETYRNAVGNGRTILENADNYTQDDVTYAINSITHAKSGLDKVVTDKSGLENKLDSNSEYLESMYINSIKVQLWGEAGESQYNSLHAEVDAKIEEGKEVKNALENEINKYEDKNADEYTNKTWEEYKKSVDKGNSELNGSYNKSNLENATQDIKDNESKLDKKAEDISRLVDLMDLHGQYLAENGENAFVNDVSNLINEDDIGEKELESLISEFEAKLDSLEEINVDKERLDTARNSVVEKVEGINGYETFDVYGEYVNTLNEIDSAIENEEDLSSEEYKELRDKLIGHFDKFKSEEATLKDLSELVSNVVDQGDYTDDSYENYKDSISLGEEILNGYGNSSQEEAKAAIDLIKESESNLEVKTEDEDVPESDDVEEEETTSPEEDTESDVEEDTDTNENEEVETEESEETENEDTEEVNEEQEVEKINVDTSTLDAAESNINTKASNLEGLNSEITTIQNNLSAIESKEVVTQEDKNSYDAQVAQYQEKVSAAKSLQEGISSDFDTLETELNGIHNEINANGNQDNYDELDALVDRKVAAEQKTNIGVVEINVKGVEVTEIPEPEEEVQEVTEQEQEKEVEPVKEEKVEEVQEEPTEEVQEEKEEVVEEEVEQEETEVEEE